MSKKQLTAVIAFSFSFIFLHFAVMARVFYEKINGNIFSDVEFSAAFSDRNGELLQVFLTSDDKFRIYRPLSDFPPDFIEAVLLQEDRYFYSHKGVNPVAVFKAGIETYIKKSRRMGASTITMQTAKLKYHLYTKSIYGKLKQIFLALYLEFCYSKNEILEFYMNLAPCGSNIEGFETAGWYYFGKSIRNLNFSENIMLAVLPQNPVKRSPAVNRTPAELIEARKVLFSRWIENHPEDQDKESFMDMQMSTVCRFPDEARHFCEMIYYGKDGRKPLQYQKHQKIIKTTLDLSLQKQCEEIFENYINQNRHFGVENGAVLLLDWKNMDIVANIGSASYYDDSIQGQVNATTSKRSPGSALKPFIYALALQEGLIHYGTMLKDTPVTFNEYSPDNYGSVFKGPVKAWFALTDSRNIPAIALNRDLSQRDLYDFMLEANVSGLKEKSHYGLSIVLGTAEVTMLELAEMYATLTNNGIYKEINPLYSIKKDTGKRLLTAESAFITRKMLEENVPPYQYKPKEFTDVKIGYKTGTSIGFKDSWSVGIFDRYIIVVWIGNFDGHGNNSFLGRTMAAPLLFNLAYHLLSELPAEQRLKPEIPPKNAVQVKVCSVSGAIPTEACEETEWSWFIPGVSPITSCKIHRKINIDTRTGYRTDDFGKPYIKTIVREFWPTDLQNLFAQAGLPRLKPPEYPDNDFNYNAKSQGFPPEIVSPMTRTDYVFRKTDKRRNKILLYAVSDADVSELLWYCGSDYIGRCNPGKTLEWIPEPGNYTVTVCDQKGRSDSVNISIVEVE
ncbi:penicillin-binding protein 1C [Treponema sp.]|uniref:penicillin-binding protein 1C n=1 Tax=Treponema sp. TaxID=166 RepID=UPI0038909F6F